MWNYQSTLVFKSQVGINSNHKRKKKSISIFDTQEYPTIRPKRTDTVTLERKDIPKRLKYICLARKELNFDLARRLLDNTREDIDTESYVFESAMLEYDSNPKSRYSAISKLWTLIHTTRSENSSTLVRSCLKLATWLSLLSQDDLNTIQRHQDDNDEEKESTMKIETCLCRAELYSRNENTSFSLRSRVSVRFCCIALRMQSITFLDPKKKIQTIKLKKNNTDTTCRLVL